MGATPCEDPGKSLIGFGILFDMTTKYDMHRMYASICVDISCVSKRQHILFDVEIIHQEARSSAMHGPKDPGLRLTIRSETPSIARRDGPRRMGGPVGLGYRHASSTPWAVGT